MTRTGCMFAAVASWAVVVLPLGCREKGSEAVLKSIEVRTEAAQQSDRAEAEEQRAAEQGVAGMRQSVDRLVAEGRQVSDAYRAAATRFRVASASADRASQSFQRASREYAAARDQSRLVTLLLSYAGSSSSLNKILCGQLANAAKSEASEIGDGVPLPNSISPLDPKYLHDLEDQGLVKDPAGLARELGKRMGVTQLQNIRALPDEAVDRLFEQGLRRLGCR